MSRCFFDTNVLLYTIDGGSPAKRAKARELMEQALVERKARISYQVVQEWLNVATKVGLPRPAVESYVRQFLLPLWTTQPTPELYSLALDIRQETQWSWYDSLIVGAAVLEDCAILYSEDLQAGRTVRGVRIVNPFV